MKLHLNKKGFTLVELLISIAIMGILVGIGGDIFATIIRAYRKAELFSLAETKGNQALTLIEQDIRSAINVKDTNSEVTLYVPSNSAGTTVRKYSFTSCTTGTNGQITLEENGSSASNLLLDTQDLLGSQIAIKKMKDSSNNNINFVSRVNSSVGDVQYDLVTISFALGAGGSDPCNNPLVTSYFQTTVNLRGGLPY